MRNSKIESILSAGELSTGELSAGELTGGELSSGELSSGELPAGELSGGEQIWLDECPLEFKPKYYRRYVDDVFILVEKIEHVGKFKEYLNSKHQNINFTSEIECDGKMPFWIT